MCVGPVEGENGFGGDPYGGVWVGSLSGGGGDRRDVRESEGGQRADGKGAVSGGQPGQRVSGRRSAPLGRS